MKPRPASEVARGNRQPMWIIAWFEEVRMGGSCRLVMTLTTEVNTHLPTEFRSRKR